MNVLCVGGAADGRRVVLRDGQKYYEIAVYQKKIRLEFPDPALEPVAHEIQRYHFFEIHPVTQAVIFAYEKLTPTEIMEALMDGYRAEKQR